MRWNMVIVALIRVYTFAIFLRAVASWLPMRWQLSEFSTFLTWLTEPALKPVRRILPRSGSFDFSPLIVMLALMLLSRALMW